MSTVLKGINARHAKVKMVTPTFWRLFACRKYEGNIGEAVEQEERLCEEVVTVRKFKYLGDRVSAGGGYDAAVTARTRCESARFRE